MGLLYAEASTPDRTESREIALYHQLECKACPLNHNPRGKIEPTGAAHPDIYILGEAPGADEEEQRIQFIGKTGQLLRSHIPKRYLDKLRWNNVIRTRPPRNRNPEFPEIESCRPSIVRDIEASKPRAIFGFGNFPLQWISGFSTVTLWRGRRMPVRVGRHACWFYPFVHPSFLQRQRRGRDSDRLERGFIGSEDERMFLFDLKKAFAEVFGDLPPPEPHDRDRAMEGVQPLLEFGSEGLRGLEAALEPLLDASTVGVDYETDRHRPYAPEARILTIGVGHYDSSFAFPLDHREARWSAVERKKVVGLWTDFLRQTKARKAVHNLAYDLEWTAVKFGEEFLRIPGWEDTQSQAAILDERRGKTKPGPFSLEFLVQQHFGFNLKKLSAVNRMKLDNTDLATVLRYNALDAKYHLLLWSKQAELILEQGLFEPYRLALRRVPTVLASQIQGVPVDQVEVRRLQQSYGEQIKVIEQELTKLPEYDLFFKKEGRDLNPNSNPDVVRLFNRYLEYPEVRTTDKYTKKEKLSVDESVLMAIVANHGNKFAEALLRLRKMNKRLSTYVDPLAPGTENSALHPDGQLHAIFNTTFAETARLSCEDPNLQNFPKRDEGSREVRRPIVPAPGCVIMAFDYGQIEARVIAMFTHDERFVKALWEDYDVHMEWAERLAYAYPRRVGGKEGIKDKKVMKKFRTDIKNQWTFPLFFGASLRSASGYLEIPEEVLAPQFDEFWEQFSGVKEWQDRQLAAYRETGYVEFLTGRRRRGPLTNNQVFNTPVQGTAAEIVLDAMCRLFETGDPELQPAIQIHDDFTYVRTPEDRYEEIAERVIDHMLAVPFEWAKIVPITVEMSVGDNWMQLEDVGTFSSANYWTKQ